MGFGSYDESEQQRQEKDSNKKEDEVEVSRHGEGHQGESTFELADSADTMLDQLKEIKESTADDEE